MLSQLQQLSRESDGRYATDAELKFIADYANSYPVRLSAYRKIQAAEQVLVRQVMAKVRSLEPEAFKYKDTDITKKCERDILYVLHYSALALILSDTIMLQERLLLWFQTIMRSFEDHQRRSDMVYRVMQDVVRQHLTSEEATIFCQILELDRHFLGVG
jgi:Phycobilisome protein